MANLERALWSSEAVVAPPRRPETPEPLDTGSRVLRHLKRELAIWHWRRSVPSANLGTTRVRKD
jgi:hypothetical protein